MDCSLPNFSVHEFSGQEYWSGLPCLPPGDLPHPGIKRVFLMSPALVGRFFTPSTTRVSFFFHKRYRCCTCPLCSSAWTFGRTAFWPDILADGHKPLHPLPAPPPGLPSPRPVPHGESAFLLTQQTIEEMCQDTFPVDSIFHVWINLLFFWPRRDRWRAGNTGWYRSAWCSRKCPN